MSASCTSTEASVVVAAAAAAEAVGPEALQSKKRKYVDNDDEGTVEEEDIKIAEFPDAPPFADRPSTQARSKFAYVYLVMKGDSYVPGALTAAFSLKKTGVKSRFSDTGRETTFLKNDIVCMVTDDVSAKAVTQLQCVFDRVLLIPYIRSTCAPLKSAKMTQMYKSWVQEGFTKWNVLNLTQYQKVLFLDADKIVFENLDALFQLPAPAATFSSPHCKPYAKPIAHRFGIHNPYYGVKHGETVSHDMVRAGLFNNGVAIIGTCVLLEPSKLVYAGYQRYVARHSPFSLDTSRGGCNSMVDEQSLLHFTTHEYLEGQIPLTWTNIHQRYNCIPWHPQWMEDQKPAVFHYFGRNPWHQPRGQWLDVEAFWEMAELLVSSENNPEKQALLHEAFPKGTLSPLANLQRADWSPRVKGCGWCQILQRPRKTYSSHNFFDARGQVQCPELIVRPGREQ